MKTIKIKNIVFATMMVAGLSLTSCRNNSSQDVGTEDGQATNGDIHGSETPMDNENSGEAAGSSAAGMSSTATDTLQGAHTGH